MSSQTNSLKEQLYNQVLIDKSLQSELTLGQLLQTKMTGFFFNANWSHPGEVFLEQLKKFYIEANSNHMDFELVFVSFDDNKELCMETYKNKHGNWFIWPYKNDLCK